MRRFSNMVLFLFFTLTIEAQQSYTVTFDHDGKTIYGTFTTPNGTGQFPTIIIDPGSGQIDRNGTLPLTDGNSACLFPALYGDTLEIYKELSQALVDSGYAVLRYDKLEYTYGANLGTITFHKLWLPVESAISYVKTRTDVDTNKIILIGHSEGSALIPYIAKNRNDIKALISIAGARTPFDSLYAWQLNSLVAHLRPCGATATDSLNAANQGNQILDYFHTIRTNTWNGSTPSLFGVPASAWYDYIRAMDSVAINYNLNQLPTLFTGMGEDIQVPPSELVRLENEITITNDFWTIPGVIHDMVPSDDPHVSTVLTDTIIYWLRQQNLTAGLMSSNKNEDSFTVFPNPFTDMISITINPDFHHPEISIFNSRGEIVFRKSETGFNQSSILTYSLKDLPKGVYFLELNDNHRTVVQKIVK